jgi:hypothetical protein
LDARYAMTSSLDIVRRGFKTAPLVGVSAQASKGARCRLPQPFGRAVLCTLLAVMVYAAQLGALLHAVSHIHGPALRITAAQPSVTTQGDAAGAEEFCLQCLAFAQVASAAAGQHVEAPVPDGYTVAAAPRGTRVPYSTHLVYLARGPPRLV